MLSQFIAIGLACAACSAGAVAAPTVAPPALVATPSPSLPDTAARRAAGLELARVAQPVELLQFGAVRGFAETARLMASQPSELASYEKRFPGFIDTLIERSTPIINKEIERSAPDLWQRMSDIYVADLTDAELQRMIAFFSSLTGKKLMKLTYENMNVEPLVNDMKKGDEVTVQANIDATLAAGASTVAALSSSELAEVARFNLENASVIQKTGPRIMAAVTEWQNGLNSEESAAEVGKLVSQLVIERAEQEGSRR
ncbi:MAG TPA: DUF2059 domain-containing protein [Sphingomicrobium sp.]|nr:DUF2059 domain-containing protein [Sphingomicrobium sp.]